jgi:hypothetical protein
MAGMGEMIYSLRKKIQEIEHELHSLGDPITDLPELISSANLLRSNEFLKKSDEKKSELLSAYRQYSKSLENMLSDVFEIQNELKDILKEQSSMISVTKSMSKKKTSMAKSKSKKKSSKK